jgi:hypothetical protein
MQDQHLTTDEPQSKRARPARLRHPRELEEVSLEVKEQELGALERIATALESLVDIYLSSRPISKE